MTEDDVRQMIRDWAGPRGLRSLADRLGVNQGDLCSFLTGNRGLGPKPLKALGLRKVVAYEKEACNRSSGDL